LVRPIPPDLRRRVVELWLEGNTYRSISNRAGVSAGAISSIIDEERKRIPDLEELRSLKIGLAEAKVALIDAVRTVNLLKRLDEFNVPVEKLSALVRLLQKYGEKAEEALDSAVRLSQIEVSQGKTYDKILSEATEKTVQLQKATMHLQDLKKNEEAAKSSLVELERLRGLDQKIRKYGVTYSRLDNIIEEGKRLGELGFISKTAEILASGLAKTGMNPSEAAITLSNLLSRYRGLEDAVARLTAENHRLQQEIEARKGEHQTLVGQIETARNLLAEEEKLHRTKVRQLEEEHEGRRRQLEASYARQIKELNDKYLAVKAKLEEEIRILQDNRQQLVEKIEKMSVERDAVQTSLNTISETLKVIGDEIRGKRLLTTLVSLTEHPEALLDPSALLKAVVAVVEGLRSHLETNDRVVGDPGKLKQQLNDLSVILAKELQHAIQKAK
jgi:hypothetical protein